jgi:hypothetical protein
VRRLLRPSVVLFGTTVAMIAGAGVLAFAGWTSRSDSVTFTVQATQVPQVPRPNVTVTLVPIITWKRVRLTPNTPVNSYIVTRHLGKTTRIVCTRSASLPTKCVDPTAPPGSPITYTVYAAHGEHWVGVDSEPSLPVGTPGSPPADGTDPATAAVDPSASAEPGASAPADSGDPLMTTPPTAGPTLPGYIPPPAPPIVSIPSTEPTPTESATPAATTPAPTTAPAGNPGPPPPIF